MTHYREKPFLRRLAISSILGLVTLFVLSACSETQFVTDTRDFTAELIKESSQIVRTQPADSMSFPVNMGELFKLSLKNDITIQNLDFEIEKAGIGIDQSESVILPRLDIMAGANLVYDDSDGLDKKPELALILKYDLNSALFQQDYTAAATATKQKLENERLIATKKVQRETAQHLAIFIYKQHILSRIKRLLAIDEKMLEFYNKIESVLPDGTGLDYNQLTTEKISHQRDAFAVQNDIDRTTNMIAHLTGTMFDLIAGLDQNNNYIDRLIDSAENTIDAKDLETLLQDSFKLNPFVKIIESTLFLAHMKKLKAEREQLPRLSASMEAGSLIDTRSEVTRDFVLKVELTYPLFDAGNNRRKIKSEEISIKKAEAQIRSSLRHHALSLKNSYQQVIAAREQFMMLEDGYNRLEKQFESFSQYQESGISDTRTALSLERTLHTSSILLLKSRLAYSLAVVEFAFYSELQFNSIDN